MLQWFLQRFETNKYSTYVGKGIRKNHIKDNIQRWTILVDCQSGFRRHYSYPTALSLFNVTDDIFSVWDKNMLIILVLLDYIKAFDRINHLLLLAILHNVEFN